MERQFSFGFGTPPVCRLGLATRGTTGMRVDDVFRAIDAGINYLNWCGQPDGLSEAVAQLGPRRRDVVLAWQLESTRGPEAAAELSKALETLQTDYIDIVTFYYVERESEWLEIASPGGAYDAMEQARTAGQVRLFGLTSHQRPLARKIAAGELNPLNRTLDRPLDLLMLRYNAAHRGLETDVFPTTDALGIPVVVYTCLRWGQLMQPTADDPPGFRPPPAPEWYRFALANPSVAVALMAPENRSELEENLSLLDDWRAPTEEEWRVLIEHGQRCRRHAGPFP